MELVINTSLSNLNDSGGSEWARKINQFYGLCFDGPQFLTPENFTVRFVLEPENVPILLQDPSLHLKPSQHGTPLLRSCLLVPNPRCGKFSLRLSQALTKEFSTVL